MPWAVPEYTKAEVDKAGRILITADETQEIEIEAALAVINNWRSSHNFPLNTFQMGLRAKSLPVDEGTLISQRIKRLSSIKLKLKRYPTMKLSQMQDIGGCRAVVSSVRDTKHVLKHYKNSSMKHKLLRIDDYGFSHSLERKNPSRAKYSRKADCSD